MSWAWVVLLVLAVGVIVAAEWPMVSGVVGADARRRRERERRKAKLRVVTTEDDDFVKSVQRDLDALPTTRSPARSAPSGSKPRGHRWRRGLRRESGRL